MGPGTTQNTVFMKEVMITVIHRESQGGTFMCCKSCWEVVCRISGASGRHSYRVISDELPTTNLFSPRGCHSRRLSEEATILNRRLSVDQAQGSREDREHEA